ncbi:MAG: PilN domain-containing protein [Candidatus Pacebacteria bacterium]|jgi:Tfp pilus assembly protein PilN|nr:PilN domain-containing protein [Candidatus Paceibacterota bacterium]
MMNLLPPTWQEKLKEDEIFKTVSILGIVAVCAALSLAMMLMLVGNFYSIRISSLEANATEKAQEIKIFDVEIQAKDAAEFAAQISLLGEFYDSQVKVSGLFSKVSDALPTGVVLTDFSYGAGGINIKGSAGDRDSLVAFKNNLEALRVFGKVDFPPDNWLKSEDISFGAQLELAKK